MTKKLSLIPLLTLALILTSCGTRGDNNTNTFDEGVVINGVRWATRNVNRPGTFVRNPEDTGRFFTFEEAKNACPQGWRLPTQEEQQSLADTDSEWITKNRRVNGRLFGSGNNQLFLPAAGHRYTDGTLYVVGYVGYYWSSTALSATNGWWLWLYSDGSAVGNANRNNGLSVRCVAK